MLSAEIIHNFNAVRTTPYKGLLCHAPFTNINFAQNGHMTACCYNRKEVLGIYPQNSINQAWYGEEAAKLRGHIAQNDLGGGCSACQELLQSGNYKGTKAIFYDEYAQKPTLTNQLKKWLGQPGVSPPRVLEFELSNTCNLECTMCNGFFSSSIRKNRENLPPLENPYDAAFVDQVAELMPYVTDMKFLGGEPFLIDIYYDIWERILEVNPKIRVHITTNGTILNNRGKKILEKMKAGIVLSIDSLDQEVYEEIRINAKFSRVMENLEFFKAMVKDRDTYLSFAVCPIIANWKGLPKMLQVANENGYPLHFNVVWTPEYVSLMSLSVNELDEVIAYLEAHVPANAQSSIAKANINVFTEFIGTLKFWKAEKTNRIAPDIEEFNKLPFEPATMAEMNTTTTDYKIAATIICWYAEQNEKQKGVRLAQELQLDGISQQVQAPSLQEALLPIKEKLSPQGFITAYLQALKLLHQVLLDGEGAVFNTRIEGIQSILLNTKKIEQAANELAPSGVLKQIQYIKQASKADLENNLLMKYN